MLFLYIFLLTFFPISNSYEILKYTIEEKSPLNTFIADLSKDLKINSNGFYQINELLLLNKNLFTINNQTGYLTSKIIFDREDMCLKQQCSCNSCEILLQLTITIQDKIHFKILEIKIKDRNDHSPNFDKQSIIHTIHIKENVPLGYRIVLPSANDPDEGINSVQSYRLDGKHSDNFDIDFSSYNIPYLIVRSSFDYQHQSSYSLLLIASDHGQPSRSDSIQLNIQILKQNDSIPTFIQTIYNIDIREDTLIGTNLLKIEAINDNKNPIFYEFLTDSPFIIDRLTGQIQLSQKLDYEREKSYQLTVKAYEQIIPTYANIFIRIIDVNDNPVLMRIKTEGNTLLKQKENDNNILFIEENLPISTTISHIILNDLDSYANGNPYLQLRTSQPPLPLIYKLIYQNNYQNTKVYSLIINQKLDREIKSLYNNMQLIAYDSGTPTLHTKLNLLLNLTDINDCIPQFHMNSTLYNINENNPIGYKIDRLITSDCDLGENSRIEYSIINQTDLLIIDSITGDLYLNQSIDFEFLNKYHEKNLTFIDLEYLIQIKDHGQPILINQIKIILRIHDLNDNSPEFDQNQSYNWSFSLQNLQISNVLGQIFAKDNDSGLQGLINYSIESFDSCLILNITSLGYIYISSISTCSLTSYTFEITATDNDLINSHSTKQMLIINIQQLNLTNNYLPKLLSLTIDRTMIDINNNKNILFILDLTTWKNVTYQPRIYLNNTNILSCWNISTTGEVRLQSQPFASSYKLSLILIDQYTNENFVIKFQIDICNSSILNSCELNSYKSETQFLLIYVICFSLLITFICIIIFSIIICLCCRKRKTKESTVYQQNFLQYNNENIKRYQNSTIQEDDRDSACIINGHSSSSNSSSSGIISKKESIIPIYPTSSTYYYDLKLAEIIKQNQHPLCIHLNELPSIPQSLSTDYGFSSLELSESSSTSTLPNHYIDDNRQLNMKSFISSHECVV